MTEVLLSYRSLMLLSLSEVASSLPHGRRAPKPQMRLKHTPHLPKALAPSPPQHRTPKPHLARWFPSCMVPAAQRWLEAKVSLRIHRISLWGWSLNTCIASSPLPDPEGAVQMGTSGEGYTSPSRIPQMPGYCGAALSTFCPPCPILPLPPSSTAVLAIASRYYCCPLTAPKSIALTPL